MTLETVALAVIIFFAIVLMIACKQGVTIRVVTHKEYVAQQPAAPCETDAKEQAAAANILAEQKKLDDEYQETQDTLRKIASSLQDIMGVPRPEDPKQNGGKTA